MEGNQPIWPDHLLFSCNVMLILLYSIVISARIELDPISGREGQSINHLVQLLAVALDLTLDDWRHDREQVHHLLPHVRDAAFVRETLGDWL